MMCALKCIQDFVHVADTHLLNNHLKELVRVVEESIRGCLEANLKLLPARCQ